MCVKGFVLFGWQAILIEAEVQEKFFITLEAWNMPSYFRTASAKTSETELGTRPRVARSIKRQLTRQFDSAYCPRQPARLFSSLYCLLSSSPACDVDSYLSVWNVCGISNLSIFLSLSYRKIPNKNFAILSLLMRNLNWNCSTSLKDPWMFRENRA